MKKNVKKAGLFLSAAFAVCLMGQVAYAQTPIGYNFRLPAAGSVTTTSVTKTNSDTYADNYCTYFGWPGSGVNWWIYYKGVGITNMGLFGGTGVSKVNYYGDHNGCSVSATLKTDASTWHECDVIGNVYP